MEPSEFVVTMLLANLASIPMEDLERPVWHGLAAMGIVLCAERFVSWVCLKNIRLRRIFCGKPVILIDNGRLLCENLRRTRVTLDELTGHLREKGILDAQQVQFAILETNGALTVFPFPRHQPPTAAEAGIRVEQQELPYTLISDGKVQPENLRLSGHDRAWLQKMLGSKGLKPEEVALLTVTKGGKISLFRR
jgi:uncharacterized membrane protein YcaP (DUF421 family)